MNKKNRRVIESDYWVSMEFKCVQYSDDDKKRQLIGFINRELNAIAEAIDNWPREHRGFIYHYMEILESGAKRIEDSLPHNDGPTDDSKAV